MTPLRREGGERNRPSIQRILGDLEHAWRRYPEMRLAQLIVNLTGATAPEVFYFEDENLVKALERLMYEGKFGERA